MGSDRGPDPLSGEAGGDGAIESRSRMLATAAYALAGFSGLVLLVWRREDRFVQFHALQSVAATVVALALAAALWILSYFPLLGFLYGMLLRLLQIFGSIALNLHAMRISFYTTRLDRDRS